MSTSSNALISPGMKLIGQWNGHVYTIERFLGKGANGQVYLVMRDRRRFALKIGRDPVDMQSEINALQKVDRKVRPQKPFLIDVDDVHIGRRKHPFYVMRYVEGKSADVFLRENGRDWLYVIGKNLLLRLNELHRQNWVFGDLKMENVIVSKYGEVELIDYGGVTQKGRAVKQFTEQYDRGYWNGGSRIADEQYDLFSFAVFIAKLISPDATVESPHALPQNRLPDQLLARIEQQPYTLLIPLLKRLLNGKIRTTKEALVCWKRISLADYEPPVPVQWQLHKKKAFVQSLFAAALCSFMIVVYLFLY